MGGSSDLDIIQQVRDGDIDRFELLIDRYQGRVLSIVRRHVPQDRVDEVAQEVFFEAYRALASFRASAPFEHWVSAIAVRGCSRFWRNETKEQLGELGDIAALAAVTMAGSDTPEALQSARQLLELGLGRLTAAERMAFLLVHGEGRSIRDAAALLGTSAISVKVRCYRARAKFRAFLGNVTKESI